MAAFVRIFDYNNVSLCEVEECVRTMRDDLVYGQKTNEECLAVYKAMALILYDLTDPILMGRSIALIVYPEIDKLFNEMTEIMKQRGVFSDHVLD